MALVSHNPATGKRLAVYRELTASQLERAVARSSRVQREWRELTPARRARCIRALGAALRSHRDALASLATDEMGKPITQGRAEVEKCAALCDYYAKHGSAALADEVPLAAPRQAHVAYDPLGTILAIMPWNFPFWQVMRAAVPALLAGNTVLLKHAPNVPGCALALERLFAKAGFPTGAFQILLIGTDPVARLIADPRVQGVTLTGSTRAGRIVAALAGAALKPVVLELGGSDAVLVFDDADLDRAAELGAQARLLNSGQSCLCAKRFIVVRSRLREFTDRFVARMAARRTGDPTDPATDIGPLARPDLVDTLHTQVTRSVRSGARILLGGQRLSGPGNFHATTVLGGVRPGMPAAEEEMFGPVAAIMVARDEADAIRLANTSAYGLGATVFTKSRARARAAIRALQAGSVFVNDSTRSSPELPFGGIKESGHGRELGAWGVRAFTNVKTVWVA